MEGIKEEDLPRINAEREVKCAQLMHDLKMLRTMAQCDDAIIKLAIFELLDKKYYIRWWRERERKVALSKLIQERSEANLEYDKEQQRLIREIANNQPIYAFQLKHFWKTRKPNE